MIAETKKEVKKKRLKISEAPLHLMMLPGVIMLIIYDYLPMGGLVIAFQRFIPAKGLFGKQEWVGWENFTYFFNMPEFRSVISNTVSIAVAKIILGLLVPLIISLLLNEMGSQITKRSIQTAIYLPHFLSWVILGGVLMRILSPSSGIVNQFLGLFGIDPIFFLGDNRWFKLTVIVTNQWKEFGWGTIIYLAALAGIDPNLYEAAYIDGANRLQQVRYVTLPGMRYIIVLMMVMSLRGIFNAGFDQIFNLYSTAVYESGDIIDTMMYRVGLIQARYGLSTAIGLLKSIISLILISLSYHLAYKWTDYRVF